MLPHLRGVRSPRSRGPPVTRARLTAGAEPVHESVAALAHGALRRPRQLRDHPQPDRPRLRRRPGRRRAACGHPPRGRGRRVRPRRRRPPTPPWPTPGEGTVLSVARAAADAVAGAADRGTSTGALSPPRPTGHRGPGPRPRLSWTILRRRAVVDAGGTAAIVVTSSTSLGRRAVTACWSAVKSPGSPTCTPVPLESSLRRGRRRLRGDVPARLDARRVPTLRATFGRSGDSTVIVGSAPMFNCHMHTDDIGAAIEAGSTPGARTRSASPTCRAGGRGALGQGGGGELEPHIRAEPPRTSPWSPSGAGDGHPPDLLVARRGPARPGGQSMNPSTADILDMIESAPGSEVVVLPNN